ncbi:hypothetical protein [Komagataeibacter rhaeticus]|nr:hypothetical protein [Komagataeibacter rhaeticus]
MKPVPESIAARRLPEKGGMQNRPCQSLRRARGDGSCPCLPAPCRV